MKHFIGKTTLQAAAVALLLAGAPAMAQDTNSSKPEGFWLTTPYPELAIKPGDTETIPLTLRNSNLPPQRAEMSVSGIPKDWKWTLKGGSREVSAAMVGPNDTRRLSLEITASKGDKDQSFPIKVTAHYGNQDVTLPLTVRVSQEATGGASLTPDLPALRGTAHSKFSYKIKLKNDSSKDALFNLSADAPDGFQTTFKQGYGSEEITGVPVKADETKDITMEVQPAHSTPAGHYPITMQASGGDMTATTKLSLDVTGQPQLHIVGPQQRLSGTAVAGKDTSYTFTVENNGSAPVNDVAMTSSPPQGWKITFEPDRIATLAPDAKKKVNVTIRPSDHAIAGDYMVSLNAGSGPNTEDAQFRVTVKTSTVWGMVGLGVIAAAVVILGMAVMRYGRR